MGLRGLSWGGFNALQIAALGPPALAAVVTACSTDDRYSDDVHYMGGNVLGYDMQLWATWAHLFFVAPPDPEVVGESWRARWLERLESIEPVIATWLSHQTPDEYWRHGSVGVNPHAITTPVLMVGGWEDGYRDAIMRFVAARPANTWAVVGPWGHGWPHHVLPGPHLDWVAREVRWWRHWLEGDDNGVERDPQSKRSCRTVGVPTSICCIVRGPGWCSIRLTSRKWPAVRGTRRSHGDPSAGGAGHARSPVWCPDGDSADFALDQCSEDAIAATIDWPLVEDMRILGRPVAHLRLLAEGGDAQVVVRLCDVAPDGASTLVAMGAGRVTGTAEQEVAVSMRGTGYVVPKGHTLRLAVTPGYWPMLWPLSSRATLTIDRERCRLDLPVVAPKATTSSIVAPEPERQRQRGSPRRWSSQVFGSDEVRMERVTDSGVVPLDDGSWWRVGGSTMWSTGDDPVQSTTTTTTEMERGRGDWQALWRATSTMTADAGVLPCRHRRESRGQRRDGLPEELRI